MAIRYFSNVLGLVFALLCWPSLADQPPTYCEVQKAGDKCTKMPLGEVRPDGGQWIFPVACILASDPGEKYLPSKLTCSSPNTLVDCKKNDETGQNGACSCTNSISPTSAKANATLHC